MRCIHCGAEPAKDWSELALGAVVCDACPLHDYPPDATWSYPTLLHETWVEKNLVIRTVALERPTKYGHHWHTYALDTTSLRTKEVERHRLREDANDRHPRCVAFVIERRQRMQGAARARQAARRGAP